MIHAAITVVFQVLVGLITGNWVIGGLVTAFFYIGREHAQAEHRWIERYAGNRRANMPWWGGFDFRVWNRKSTTDWAMPIVFLIILITLSNVLSFRGA